MRADHQLGEFIGRFPNGVDVLDIAEEYFAFDFLSRIMLTVFISSAHEGIPHCVDNRATVDDVVSPGESINRKEGLDDIDVMNVLIELEHTGEGLRATDERGIGMCRPPRSNWNTAGRAESTGEEQISIGDGRRDEKESGISLTKTIIIVAHADSPVTVIQVCRGNTPSCGLCDGCRRSRTGDGSLSLVFFCKGAHIPTCLVCNIISKINSTTTITIACKSFPVAVRSSRTTNSNGLISIISFMEGKEPRERPLLASHEIGDNFSSDLR